MVTAERRKDVPLGEGGGSRSKGSLSARGTGSEGVSYTFFDKWISEIIKRDTTDRYTNLMSVSPMVVPGTAKT